jgi:predicted DNA-binding transcriptional regulator AlpA
MKSFFNPFSDKRHEYSDYEPYDLSELGRIAREAEKASGKIKDPDSKIRCLTLAIEEIGLIIDNSILVKRKMDQAGEFYDPVEIQNQIDLAISIRKRLELKIHELQLAELQPGITKQNESGNKADEEQDKALSKAVDSTPDKPNMTVKEVAEYINKSPSWIYQNAPLKAIPSTKIGGEYGFIKVHINAWLEAGCPKNWEPVKSATSNGKPAEVNSEKKQEKRPEYTFQVPRELFTNVFVEKGYLTEPNAIKTADRLGDPPKGKDCSPIEWKGSLKSLFTFILVLDLLQLLKSDPSNFRPQKSYPNEGDGIELAPLMRNFELEKYLDDGKITRYRVGVMDALNNIMENAKRNSGKEVPFKESLKSYYDGKINIAKKFEKGIDLNMLKIVSDTIHGNK